VAVVIVKIAEDVLISDIELRRLPLDSRQRQPIAQDRNRTGCALGGERPLDGSPTPRRF
jgi:hypothetical protein